YMGSPSAAARWLVRDSTGDSAADFSFLNKAPEPEADSKPPGLSETGSCGSEAHQSPVHTSIAGLLEEPLARSILSCDFQSTSVGASALAGPSKNEAQ
ncbi:hypothetical protein CYMTET_16916, partial [Cymbomonas tetramitiformis]